MLIGITDKATGRKYHICGGFPSASGKTNLAMMLAPDDLGTATTSSSTATTSPGSGSTPTTASSTR